MKMLRVLSSNIMLEAKVLIVLLIVTLKLRTFFETNDEVTIDCVIVDKVTKVDEVTKIKLIIIE